MTHTSSILLVCTGNICRSPAAELLIAQALGQTAVARVRSAGTRALPGRAIAEPMAALLSDLGVPTESFRSQQLTLELIAESDLILTMDRAHRSEVVRLDPGALRRTFTLNEFARILEKGERDARGMPVGRTVGELAAWAAARRRAAGTVRGKAPDDIPDPYRSSARAYRRSLDQLRSAVDVVTDALRAA